MKFALIVLSPPLSAASYSAYQFASAVLRNGHELQSVFFYQDGAYNGNAFATPPQDELNLAKLWPQLKQNSAVELIVCVAAGIRRGVFNSEEAKRHGLSFGNLGDEFTLGGLGLLCDTATQVDRLLTFG